MKNKMMITAMSAILLASGSMQSGAAFAHEAPVITQTAAAHHFISKDQVIAASSKWVQKMSYVQMGGFYEEGEYKTFTHKGQTYRYLSKDIDTRRELLRYLTESVTADYAEQFIKEMGIIQYRGKLAQLEADGGSLLQWEQAEVVHLKTAGNRHTYKLIVPIGETTEKSVYHVHLKRVSQNSWKIDQLEYQKDVTADIPGNINPAFVFFHYLLTDSSVSQEQLAHKDVLDVRSFKKGIEKVEIKSMENKGWVGDKVEYAVTFHADLARNYKGSLKKGENRLYFLIEHTGHMEFKIVSVKNTSHSK
ncbi:DL-endopeptidase inhibitor IseA family protein [Planococcus salinus]|uniref:Uncharacterized protein n=1 Tax=Planococcus salinus TaxID=1848460 RepID=A0A3M8P8A5_9BACL|nr:DL-endopeptidase inhibitor IseA family protein [Planococcus salinus]RNF39893.1 hypothetical protein EEX84_07995 [Planococcus salinus]